MSTINVTVRLGADSTPVSLDDTLDCPATVGDALERVNAPANALVTVGGRSASDDTQLRDGDIITVSPAAAKLG